MFTSKQLIFDAKIGQRKEFATNAVELELLFDQPFLFSPGQYFWLEILETAVTEVRGKRQAFSITNAPTADNKSIRLLFRNTAYIFKQAVMALEPGSKVRVHGPFGSVYNPAKLQNRPIVMIAGGVGVSPFLAVLESLKANPPANICTLIFCNHDDQMATYLSWLSDLAKQANWFRLVSVQHRFTWADAANVLPDSQPEWWIAGRQGFVDDVYEALRSENISEADMVFEQNYPSRQNNLDPVELETSIEQQGVLAHAIQDSSNHVIITDKNGLILFANQAAQRTTGYSLAEMKGNTPRLWGGLMKPEFYHTFWKQKRLGIPFNGELINRRKTGEFYYAKAHISPLFDNNKQVIGYIGTEEDLTEIKIRQEKIESLNNRLNLATQAAKIGVWEIDLIADTLIWDERMYALHGITKTDFENPNEAIEALTHPEDKKLRQDKIYQALDGKTNCELTYRIVRPDKTIRYLKCYGLVEKNNSEKPIKIVGVSFDITDEKQIDNAKSEFVSLASHQLRTPLTAINWYTEMLLNGDVGETSPEQKNYLAEIYNGSNQMSELVTSFLNVSRIELGSFAVDPLPTNLLTLAERVLKELSILIEEKYLQVTLDQTALPSISVDQKLIKIVYTNLLTNAIKYTPHRGSIKITHQLIKNSRLGECIRIEISDTGLGIPQNEQTKIFEKLYRASNARESDPKGSGLGLYIVKAIVEQAGGEIKFTSLENQGTTFMVDLPLIGMKPKSGSRPLE